MKLITTLFLVMLFSLPTYALEEGIYTIIIKKQQEKKSTRWSLADWLVTKKRIALMDQWLALHSSTNWFDLLLDYSKGLADEQTDGTTIRNNLKPERLGISAYLKFLGVEYNKFNYNQTLTQSDWRLNLLLLGSSVQSTHIRLYYGKRDYSYVGFSSYNQNFYGIGINIYFADFLGSELQYTKYTNSSSADNSYTMDGNRTSFGLFTELWILRLYFNKYIENNDFTGTSTVSKKHDGYLFGARLYF